MMMRKREGIEKDEGDAGDGEKGLFSMDLLKYPTKLGRYLPQKSNKVVCVHKHDGLHQER